MAIPPTITGSVAAATIAAPLAITNVEKSNFIVFSFARIPGISWRRRTHVETARPKEIIRQRA